MGLIEDNLADIRGRIERAADRAGRPSGEVRLMAVTKTQPRELAEAAYQAGVRLFGENRIGEAESKLAGFHPDAELHMIGHLQRNKARRAAALVSCVQSIDKVETASALQRHAAELGRTVEILLEVNTSDEQNKEGFREDDELFRALETILEMQNLRPKGLMTVALFTDDEQTLRRCFRRLVALRAELRRRFPVASLDELSMGMSNDFEIAIEEGSTLVRVGSAIFGPRRPQ